MLIQAVTPLVTNPVTIFLVVLGIMLLVPLLLQRLKIPYVIGLILAGMAVGPYGFNILARDMSFEVFGQVGILYLMFLAGLEIDMFHLQKNMSKGLTFGLLTFFVPLVIGLGAAVAFLGLDVLGGMLVASMFASHTLLAYPIVSRFGLTKSPPVVIAVAGTIVAVMGSLIVLAAVAGVCREGEFRVTETLRLLLYLTAFCLLTIYVYPRLTRWFFKRYIDRVSQFIYILSMVFLAAVAAQRLGIEGVFGSFFAGLVLNRFVPAKSPLMTRLEFVGNAIFIPYFLIGVGMMINVGVITRGWGTLYVAGVMSVVAMTSKWLAAWFTQRIFRLKALDRSMLYQLSNAHTAVALAVVTIGYNMALFSEEILNGTIVMILVTCTVSSLGVERASKRLRMLDMSSEAEEEIEKGGRRPPHTLITVSNPITSPQLVDLALLMQGNDTRGSKLYALHVRSDNSPSSRAIGRNSLDVAEKAAAVVDASLIPLERFDVNVVSGVLNTIAERDITEVIIGLHRRTNVIDSFFGSKIEQLVKSTPKMVVITRCFIPVNTVTRIVVAVPAKSQYETGFRRWVEALGSLARELGCRIIFHCADQTWQLVRAVLMAGRYDVRAEHQKMNDWDDFVMMANSVLDDDLFVVVTARRTSVSFDSDMDALPDFMQRYFSRNNLVVIYPEQMGVDPDMETMSRAMLADFETPPTPLWLKVRALLRRLTGY
ncbi:MAG: cation:proton antiporter [Bacteroidales bacterium]|nr:cation:proton antiporter [Bacteroidales bacterium]